MLPLPMEAAEPETQGPTSLPGSLGRSAATSARRGGTATATASTCMWSLQAPGVGVQRLVIRGKSCTLGLGSYRLVSLADARELALANRKVARSRGASTTDVMLAGNWKTSRMVAHYSAGALQEPPLNAVLWALLIGTCLPYRGHIETLVVEVG